MDWYMIFKAFLVGGMICVIGQILIDKTKLTPARILVFYVSLGAILGGLGIYKKLVDYAGCGATVPLTGFGNLLSKGTISEIKNSRFNWCIYWWNKSSTWWNCRGNIFRLYCLFNFKTKNKKTITN